MITFSLDRSDRSSRDLRVWKHRLSSFISPRNILLLVFNSSEPGSSNLESRREKADRVEILDGCERLEQRRYGRRLESTVCADAATKTIRLVAPSDWTFRRRVWVCRNAQTCLLSIDRPPSLGDVGIEKQFLGKVGIWLLIKRTGIKSALTADPTLDLALMSWHRPALPIIQVAFCNIGRHLLDRQQMWRNAGQGLLGIVEYQNTQADRVSGS